MKIEEVLPAYREGGRIKRSLWGRGVRFNECDRLTYRDVIADDWEIVEEPKSPKLMAPCIFAYDKTSPYGQFGVSEMLFGSREDAGYKYTTVVKWPARDGEFFEVPQE